MPEKTPDPFSPRMVDIHRMGTPGGLYLSRMAQNKS